MKKISTLLMMLFAFIGAWAQVYTPGARTTTLEAGKKYFISAATFYSNARPNLLYNNNGNLAYSNNKPTGYYKSAYVFTVEKIDGETYFIKNSDGKYLQSDNLASTETETGVKVVPYGKEGVKDVITCGYDVQACDEQGNKIEYNNIDGNTPIVCVYSDADKGWRHINGLEIGKATPFAFYEAKEGLQLELTTDVNNPVYYTIKNMRGNAYAAYDGDTETMKLLPTVEGPDHLFYFTKGSTEGTYKIHTYGTDKKCAAYNSWTEDGIDWYIVASGNNNYVGFAISKEATLTSEGSEAWNDYQNEHTSINWYGGDDAGSVWSIEKHQGVMPGLQLSTEENIVLHYIRSNRRTSYVNFDGHNVTFKEGNEGLNSYWYFVEDETATGVPEGYVAVKIFNAAHPTAVENYTSGYMGDSSWPAKTFLVGLRQIKDAQGTGYGYVIYLPGETNGWHDYSGTYVGAYGLGDRGSLWRIYPANKTVDQLKNEANTAKTNALAFIANAEEADFYTYSDEAIATAKSAVEQMAINKVYDAINVLKTVDEPINTLKAAERSTTNPVAGQYIQLKNKQYNKYLKDNGSGLNSVDDVKDLATLWFLEAGDDASVKFKNVKTGKYIGQIRQSAAVTMVEAADAKQFAFTNQADCYAVFKETSGGDYAYGHIAGENKLVGWEKGADATQWIVSTVTLPEEGKYYFIECPLFYNKQGVKKALYSDGTYLQWKTLDGANKSFYWTVEETSEGVYALKNANDNKYVLGKESDRTSWTMEVDATGAGYTIELAGEGQVFIKIAGRHLHANNHSSGQGSGSNVVSWETNSANSASAWLFVQTENPDFSIAVSALQNKVDELQYICDNATGALGYYSLSLKDVLPSIIAEANDVLNANSENIADYENALTDLTASIEELDFEVVKPVSGSFYRIKNNSGTGYLNGGTGTGRSQFAADVAEAASSVFYLDGNKLLSYTTGKYLANSENFVHYTDAVGAEAGTTFAFSAAPVVGKLLITFNNGNRSFYSASTGDSNAAGSGQTGDSYRFTLEEVTSLPVTITEAGYATFFAPVALTLPAEGLKAYTVTVNGEWATLNVIEGGVIPANTGVVLCGAEGEAATAGTYNLTVAESAEAISGNELLGTVAASYVTADAYALGLVDGEVGFYTATKNQQDGASWLNNGFKAYLPKTGVAPTLRFNFGGNTTAIESVVAPSFDANAPIYDLSGRRVMNAVKGGLYIQNGKKFIVK